MAPVALRQPRAVQARNRTTEACAQPVRPLGLPRKQGTRAFHQVPGGGTFRALLTLAQHEDGAPRCEQTAAIALLERPPARDGKIITAEAWHCQRTIKKTGQTSTERRYYLSRAAPGNHRDEQWLGLIRGHWGGVEVRHRGRRDALLGGDDSRSRHANLLANVALLRRALLALLAEHHPDQPRPPPPPLVNPDS